MNKVEIDRDKKCLNEPQVLIKAPNILPFCNCLLSIIEKPKKEFLFAEINVST